MGSQVIGLRNIVILAAAQVLSGAGISALLLVGGIIGNELAPGPALATMSISITVLGVAAFTVPAAMIMQRLGRRRGFALGASFAALAMLLAVVAVNAHSFWLFCLATFVVGWQGAFAQQFRFAAMESVDPRHSGRAVSAVLLGGIAAGWLGPEIAQRGAALLPTPYAGSFVILAILYGSASLLLFFGLRDLPAATRAGDGPARPMREVIRQPIFILAVVAGATAYAVMSFIMTATPLELHDVRHFGLDDTAWVIQSHIMAMYIPSLVSGFVIERFGPVRVMLAGTALLAACAVGALISEHLVHYWGALVLLGVGWNFQFVSATVLLSRAARPAERYRAQAANDFTVFAVQALASLSAGGVLLGVGWRTLNLVTLPLLAATAILALVVGRRLT